MIRKAVIVVLTLAAFGAGPLWIDSRRARPTLNGNTFNGSCLDIALPGNAGIHAVVSQGGIGFFYRRPVEPNAVGAKREVILTARLGYGRFPYTAHKPCILNAGHHVVEPPGMRLVVHFVAFPLWFLMVAFAAYPTLAFYRGPLRRYRRRRRGLCVTCGYDLTGNVSGVCPECGTEIGQP